ncbi:MAG: decaprenyl-phosphate phosphoribosyltransferase [Chloroflexi bacterium]|nr:decaprenyl-phosphate phosphoribosyltransferase [Chloroflexota bacterium]
MANDEAAIAATQAASAERAAQAPARGAAGLARALVKEMRPRQWTKNGIVFLALLFSVGQQYHLTDTGTWVPKFLASLVAFFCFAMVSSAEYLVNDIRDVENDRAHPRKRFRPIAAGLLPVRTAWIAAAVLAVIGNGAAFALSWQLGLVVLGYCGLMLAYTYHLKHIVLLDLMVIAAGFVLRAMGGALAIDVPISPWLYVVTALGALFLGINKRRAELVLLEDGAGSHRKILEEYSVGLLDQMGNTVTAAVLMAYGLYTFTAEGLPNNHSMMLTIPFVLYGIFRYLYLVDAKKEGGSPEEVLLRDVPIMLTLVGWALTAGIVLLVSRG